MIAVAMLTLGVLCQAPLVSNPELRAATVDSAIKKHFQLQIDLDRRLLLEAVELSE